MFARTVLTPITLLLVLADGQSSAQQGAEQKTGRIEGRVLEVPSVADRPKLTVRSIELFEKDSGRPFSKAEVDSEGHFVFEDVPAGRVRLQPLFRVGESDYDVSCSSALLLPAILRSEAPLQITLFGKGRPIVGKVVLPPEVKPERVRIWLGLPAPPARTLRGATLDLYSLLKANALESPVDAEGRFRIEGVRE